MKVAIVKYNAGNIRSVENAMKRLGIQPLLTDEPHELLSADKVIFPGVGEASSAMAYLRQRGLVSVITALKQPVLGICLGMQLLCASSEESETKCFGVFPQNVVRFSDAELKVPHVGWNNIFGLNSPLFEGIAEGSRVFFVHGYYVEQSDHSIASATYGSDFSAAAAYENFYAVQFHPEKSGAVGARILENFLNL